MTNHLAVYLNDHLAGAAAALEILDTLARLHEAPELTRFAADLRAAIAADRDELMQMMTRAAVEPSAARRAVGWIAEKAAELKVRADDPLDGALRTFELIEIVSLGIDGKRALWSALSAIAGSVPGWRDVDFPRLSASADAQRRSIETHRLHWATTALSRRPA